VDVLPARHVFILNVIKGSMPTDPLERSAFIYARMQRLGERLEQRRTAAGYSVQKLFTLPLRKPNSDATKPTK